MRQKAASAWQTATGARETAAGARRTAAGARQFAAGARQATGRVVLPGGARFLLGSRAKGRRKGWCGHDRGTAMRVSCTVNGQGRQADDVWPGESLLYVLRERLGLPGAKNACEQGECGSCTVYLDGLPVCACLVAAGQAEGASIVTVEGLRAGRATGDDVLHPVQRAFLDAGAVQCGFCTPGLIVAVDDLLERVPQPTDPEIREALAGNLCRCTGYRPIV
ncbi:MAG TPA: (2Fe-2S)-binding protein, partial [Actinoplanes sp.]|nr:(2Fe-2S)-binding protein [Actinoplanes sp.]